MNGRPLHCFTTWLLTFKAQEYKSYETQVIYSYEYKQQKKTTFKGQGEGVMGRMRWATRTSSIYGLFLELTGSQLTGASGRAKVVELGSILMDPDATASKTKSHYQHENVMTPWNFRFIFLASTQTGFKTRKKEEHLNYADFPPPPELGGKKR